jgi:hypothetical protein
MGFKPPAGSVQFFDNLIDLPYWHILKRGHAKKGAVNFTTG